MDFSDVWGRVKSETELKTLTNLAKLIEITQQSVSERKKKNDFPLEWAYKISKKYELSLEWLLTGTGKKRTGEGIDSYIIEINEWFEEIKQEDTANEDWFKVQFKKLFPEFNKWIRSREDEKEKRKAA